MREKLEVGSRPAEVGPCLYVDITFPRYTDTPRRGGESARGYKTDCFSWTERHSSCSFSYRRNCTSQEPHHSFLLLLLIMSSSSSSSFWNSSIPLSVLLLAVASSWGQPLEDNSIHGGGPGGLLEGCRGEAVSCLAAGAVAALDRAARSPAVELVPGLVSLEGEPERSGRGLQSIEAIQASSPTDALDSAYRAAVAFLKGRSLRIQLPEDAPESLDRAIEEGRAKLKKKYLPILMLVGAKLVALLPLAIGAIGLMAIKALVVGKLALVIAAVIAFQKFFSGGSSIAFPSFGKTPSYDAGAVGGSSGWSSAASPSGGPYYRRSMDASQDLAYSAHIPASVDSNAAPQ